jgi:transcriptional regulator with XRE-family HTH domain
MLVSYMLNYEREVIMMTLGEKIRSIRKAKGMTQQELAEKLNTTKQTIGKYEKGIVTNLPLFRINELARALSTTPAYLTGWEEDKDYTSNKALLKAEIDDMNEEQVALLLAALRAMKTSK